MLFFALLIKITINLINNPILMRTEVALLTLLAVTAITLYTLNDSHTVQNKDFELWKAKYGKVYSPREESYRISIWLKNLEFVEAHNERHRLGEETYEVEMNSFADLSNEEFNAKYLIKYPPKVTSQCKGDKPKNVDLPTEIDWTEKGAVTGVKNQGQCGSCWAFSTTGSLEGAHFNAEGKLLSFSEQQLVDCSGSYGNQGCNGGLMNLSFFYVKDHGITTEDKYAYHGVKSTCKYDQKDQAWSIKDCVEVDVDSELSLRAAVALNPVSVAIQANQLGFQLYKKGVFSGRCGHKLDHGVLAVGYGELDKKEFFKVKNSWGAGWGMNGYILIKRTPEEKGPGECGIQMAASYPVA